MIDCATFEEHLDELLGDPGAASGPAAEHARSCPRCGALLAAHRRLAGELTASAEAWSRRADPDLHERIANRLQASRPEVRTGVRRTSAPLAGLRAVAATALIGLAVWAILRGPSRTQRPEPKPPGVSAPAWALIREAPPARLVERADGLLAAPVQAEYARMRAEGEGMARFALACVPFDLERVGDEAP